MLLYQVVKVHELGGVCARLSLWERGAYTGLFQQGEERVQSSSVKWRNVYRSLPTREEACKVLFHQVEERPLVSSVAGRRVHPGFSENWRNMYLNPIEEGRVLDFFLKIHYILRTFLI